MYPEEFKPRHKVDIESEPKPLSIDINIFMYLIAISIILFLSEFVAFNENIYIFN